MQLVRRYRLPALLCAFAVLVCELIARPFTTMGVCDDGPYILIAQKLAATGHVFYNGGETAMLGWQLYLGAAFIKLFGPSFTTVRMSTLLVAMVLAFLLQRTMVRVDISERNATLATLALVLSPIYLMLSVTFMSDIQGLFAVVICLYGCLRALQAASSSAAIGWLTFAVATNAICGSSRQIAWLGVLVMVPSALWLFRANRRVLIAGIIANLAGAAFILGCMRWFQLQPFYLPALPHSVSSIHFPLAHTSIGFLHLFLAIPCFLLPIFVLFIPEVRKSRPRFIAIVCVFAVAYILVAVHREHLHPDALLEPTLSDWFNTFGVYLTVLKGNPPVFLHRSAQIVLTILSFGGLIGLIASFLHSRGSAPASKTSPTTSWQQLLILLVPFTLANLVLLIPRASDFLTDRYLLELLLVTLLCLVRYYQERVQLRLPLVTLLLIAIMAIYSITVTHNTFALYRARVVLATQLHAAGLPDTSIDNGWEYNYVVELSHSDFLNDLRIVLPAHAYVPPAPPPVDTCAMYLFDETPHIHPLYGVSFDPDACYGPAPFAPVHYSRWLASQPGTLYVVRYTPLPRP